MRASYLTEAGARSGATETVRIMSGRFVEEATIEANLRGKNLDEQAIVAHPEISAAVRASLAVFARAIEGEAGSVASS
jgi:hypothetical protein